MHIYAGVVDLSLCHCALKSLQSVAGLLYILTALGLGSGE